MNELQAANMPVPMPTHSYSLILDQQPSDAIAQARTAAKALMEIIGQKKNPVKFNGEQYLEFEDWQMVGHFYGLNAKVTSTAYVEMDGAIGFTATAVIYQRSSGTEISAADGMCMNDEPVWRSKPLSQLKSMAQTRACGKAFRNVLSWVVVLAGYKPTPAEEMNDQTVAATPYPAAQQPEGVDLIGQIKTWLLSMNGGDVAAAQSQLRAITKWNAKGTGEEKFLRLEDLAGVAKNKPEWIKKVHKTVGSAFIASRADSARDEANDALEPDNLPA